MVVLAGYALVFGYLAKRFFRWNSGTTARPKGTQMRYSIKRPAVASVILMVAARLGRRRLRKVEQQWYPMNGWSRLRPGDLGVHVFLDNG